MLIALNKLKVLRLFFDNPQKEFYLREISRATKVPVASTHIVLKELERQGIVSREKTPAIDKYRAILDTEFLSLKRSYNIYTLQKSKGIQQFISYTDPQAVWLCGAYSQGRDQKTDPIIIYSLDSKYTTFQQMAWEKEIGRAIHIVHITPKKIDEYTRELLEGVFLHGRIKEAPL